ncbi:MAG: hypothetical protein IJ313_06710 [Clostridia bacterium]|nr:hypothetical protein [Clostridia bacterium]
MMKHALIVGARHVGKSTLIRRVLDELCMPVFGFETKKEDWLADEENGSPVYIYVAGEKHEQREDNLVGYCKDRHPTTHKDTFDRFALRLVNPPKGSIVLLDEIGFMESSSEAFCQAIMSLLDGDIPVIAAVKHNSTPFLDAVKRHTNACCFTITEENRDELYGEVLDFVKAQVG